MVDGATAGLALLLDSGFGSLEGSATSVERVRAWLTGRGFACVSLRGAEVVHQRVAGELKALRQRLRAGEPFVLYFVGHGERVRDVRAAPGGPLQADVTLLVTHDLFVADSPRPGIAGAELLEMLAPIAELTGNVTVILDCCRAATMAAGAVKEGQARLAEVLARATPALRTKYAVRSPAGEAAAASVVRLVAATEREIAVERILADGTARIGLFTDALITVLERPGSADAPWEQLMPEVQELVLAGCDSQRPGVEGPRHRVPFTLRERPPVDDFLVRAARRGWVLRGGRLHGIEVGDRFALADATAVATEVVADVALLQLEEECVGLPSQLRARRIACSRRQAVACAPALRGELALALADAPELELADGEALATIEVAGDTIVLRDRHGPLQIEPATPLVPAIGRMVRTLRRLARWERQAPVIAGLAALAVPIDVAWGIAGADAPLTDGAVLPADAELWLRASGTGKAPEVFVSVLHLRADGALEHLTDALDHGVSVPGRGTVDLLDGPGCRRPDVAWPAGLPREAPRGGALILLVSARPRSLHRMATSTWLPRDGPPVWSTRNDPALAELTAVVLRYRVLPRAGDLGDRDGQR